MQFLFDDDTFSFEALRTTGFANYGGADLGEVLATASRITDGDQASWHRAWKATADRVAELGERSLAAGHRVTARENLLRASNYYRNAAAFVLDNPADNPEVASRPTLIYTSGYDSTSEECDRIAGFGYSLGGYLLARAAAFEHRLAALILDDGVHDLASGFADNLPPFLVTWLRDGHDYTLDGVADQILAPTLIMEGEHDTLLAGQPERVEKALTAAPTTRVTLTEREGAGEHTHAGALARAHQVMFDWLDTTRST